MRIVIIEIIIIKIIIQQHGNKNQKSPNNNNNNDVNCMSGNQHWCHFVFNFQLLPWNHTTS